MADAIEKSLPTWGISKELSDAVIAFHTHHSLIPLVLHEYSHTVNKDPNAHENLGVFYTDIEETRANTMMLSIATLLEQKKHFQENTAKYMFIRILLYLPYLYEEYTVRHQRESYYFAGLYWLKKAEEYGIITIDETVVLNENILDEQLETLIADITKYFHDLSHHASSERKLSKQKKDMFLYGADLAMKLAW
jgi:hypothetical protein